MGLSHLDLRRGAVTPLSVTLTLMQQNAVIYTRLSAERSGSDHTLSDQEAVCRQLAEARGLTVVEIFAEGAGVSAYSGAARPALDALRAYVVTNPGTAVVSWEISRLTRRLTDLSGWIELIEQHRLRIVTPTIDTEHGGLVMLTLMAAMAHEESAQKSTRVQAGKARQRSAGRFMGSRAPTGFVLAEDIVGGLTIEPESAAVMREAARVYLDERMSLRKVADTLNVAGHRTGRGNKFIGSSLRKSFYSPLIAGFTETDEGTLVKCAGLDDGGVLTPERWRELRLRIDSRSTKVAERRPPTTLLSAGDVLKCSGCGGGMTPERRGERRTYRCLTKNTIGASACPRGVAIGADVVDQFAVLQCLYEIAGAQTAYDMGHPERLESILSMFTRVERPGDAGVRADLLAAKADIEVRRDVIMRSFLAGKLDATTYESGLDSITSQLSTIEADLAVLPDEGVHLSLPVDPGVWLSQLSTGELTPGGLPAALLAVCGSLEVARNVLAASLGTITVLPSAAGLKPGQRLRYAAPQAL